MIYMLYCDVPLCILKCQEFKCTFEEGLNKVWSIFEPTTYCQLRNKKTEFWMLTLTFPDFGASKNYCWYTNRWGQQPDADVDYLCFERCTKIQSFHRVTHSNVSINTHHGECENAGKHVIIVNRNHYFTQHVTKGPGVHQVLGALERHGRGNKSICHSQVEDVDVGRCLHLCVPAEQKSKALLLQYIIMSLQICNSQAGP